MAHFAFFGELLARLSPPGRTLLRTTQTLDICISGAEANVATDRSGDARLPKRRSTPFRTSD